MEIKISLIVPAYCESGCIDDFVCAVSNVLEQANISYEILFVDDGSTDDTWDIIVNAAENAKNVRAIRLSRNFGKECALFAGIDHASGELIVTIDVDLQHPVELIPKMYEAYLKYEVNVVECVKTQRQKESFINRFFANIYYGLFSKLTAMEFKNTGDFQLLDRKALIAIRSMKERGVFFRGMTQWIGLKRIRIPFVPNYRKAGSTKWSFAKKIALALSSLTSYTAKPLLIIAAMTFVFFIFSLAIITETLLRHIFKSNAEGFPTVIFLICITGTAILLSMSLLAIYISQIFNEIKARPRYIVMETYPNKQNEKI